MRTGSLLALFLCLANGTKPRDGTLPPTDADLAWEFKTNVGTVPYETPHQAIQHAFPASLPEDNAQTFASFPQPQLSHINTNFIRHESGLLELPSSVALTYSQLLDSFTKSAARRRRTTTAPLLPTDPFLPRDEPIPTTPVLPSDASAEAQISLDLSLSDLRRSSQPLSTPTSLAAESDSFPTVLTQAAQDAPLVKVHIAPSAAKTPKTEPTPGPKSEWKPPPLPTEAERPIETEGPERPVKTEGPKLVLVKAREPSPVVVEATTESTTLTSRRPLVNVVHSIDGDVSAGTRRTSSKAASSPAGLISDVTTLAPTEAAGVIMVEETRKPGIPGVVEMEEVDAEEKEATTLRPSRLERIRWCVLGEEQFERCLSLADLFRKKDAVQLRCVLGRHSVDCMRLISQGKADAMSVPAEQMFIAGKKFRLQPLVYEEWPHKSMADYFTEDAVVVIRKSADFSKGLWSLQGKKLCMAGTSRNNIQFQALANILLPLGMMPVYRGHCDSVIPNIAAHFGPSCVPGPWSLDKKARQNYPQLCLLCERVCTEQGFHAGPDGALRCLDKGADVAFTDGAAIARSSLDPNVYERLCIQGAKVPLNGSCAWLGRRTDGVAISHEISRTQMKRWKRALFEAFDEFYKPSLLHGTLLSKNNFTQLADYYHEGYVRYLGLVFMRSMETPFPNTECRAPKELRWCFTLRRHEEKCENMALTLSAERLRPSISCLRARTTKQCQLWIRQGVADITVLQPEEAIAAVRHHNFVAVATESFGTKRKDDATGYLVALVKKSRNITLETLIGARACHTGVDDFLGWEAPYILLEKYYQIPIPECDFGQAASEVFWQSCVPGIRDVKGPQDHSGNLCSLCAHDCARHGRFAGPKGALACMQQQGEITFVTNASLELIPGPERHNYELLCLNGARAPLGLASRCHWLALPTPTIVVSADRMSVDDRRKVTSMLMEAQKLFGGAESGKFSLFATPWEPNSLFDLATRRIRPVWPEDDLAKALGQDFYSVRQRVLHCNGASRMDAVVVPVLGMLAYFAMR